MSNASKNILLTFDFELFLGSKSGSVENCLLKPTLKLIDIIKRHQLSVVFFVDTLYLYRLKELSSINSVVAGDYEKVLNVLRSVIVSGGYVFHHIHPHWLDAVYLQDINQWDVGNKKRFALSNLNSDEIEDVFLKSEAIISEIYSGTQKPYITGYRAGGLYAQPFEAYKKQMEKYNILLDFSVLKCAKSEGESFKFDYSNTPQESIYKFSNDLLIKDGAGKFTEISMDQFQLSGIPKIINGLYYRLNVKKDTWKRYGDGSASGNQIKSAEKKSKFSDKETFSIELLNHFKALLYFKYLNNNNFMHVISHPKLFSEDNLSAFEYFIYKLLSKYKVETDLFRILKNNNV